MWSACLPWCGVLPQALALSENCTEEEAEERACEAYESEQALMAYCHCLGEFQGQSIKDLSLQLRVSAVGNDLTDLG